MKEKFRVYLSGFKLRKIINDRGLGICFIWLILVIDRINDHGDDFFSNSVFLGLFGVLLPMFLIVASMFFHKINYDKVFYLLPMTLEERRKTIVSNYLFAVKIHLIIGIIPLCLVLIMARVNIFTAAFMLLNVIILSFMIIPKGFNEYVSVRFVMVVVACFITQLLEVDMFYETRISVHVFMWLIMCIFIIPVAYSCKKKIIEEFDYAMTYKEIKKAK